MLFYTIDDYRIFASDTYGYSDRRLDELLNCWGFVVAGVARYNYHSIYQYSYPKHDSDALTHWMNENGVGKYEYIDAYNMILFESSSDAMLYKLTMG